MVAEGKNDHAVNNRKWVSEWMIKFDDLSPTPESNPYKLCNHNLSIGITFSHKTRDKYETTIIAISTQLSIISRA